MCKEMPLYYFSGWTLSTNCSDYGIYERESKASSMAAVNGGYQFQHYATCDTGKNIDCLLAALWPNQKKDDLAEGKLNTLPATA